jgi:hypothetical protein
MDLNQTATMKFNENKWLSLHFYVAILLILKHASVTSVTSGSWLSGDLLTSKRPGDRLNVGRNDGYTVYPVYPVYPAKMGM